jgi:spoIIIJ-associated protein
MSHRFEGRNLEEALSQASQTLGVERWQLTHHVLLEKRGFLGGMKRVVIDVDVNADAAPPAAPPAPLAAAPDAAPMARAAAPVARAARPQRAAGGGGRGRSRRTDSSRDSGFSASRDEHRGRGGRGRGRRREEEDDLQPGDFEKFMGEVPEQGTESDAAKLVREWCERVVALSRLELAVRTEENETQIIVRLYRRDVRRLVDQHGELLDAIQVLANKALVGRKVEKEIELDAEQFKDHRIEDLGRRAREAADRVREGGPEELLPAMTPIERRIVHLALESDAQVTTVSRGDGFYKRVAIVRRTSEATES